jgi:putative tricarboxylic transport membrane protein
MLPTVAWCRRATGLFMVALGGLAAYGGSRLPPVPGQQIGPNVFPLVVGIGLAICGGMIAFGIGRSPTEKSRHLFNRFPVSQAGA